MQCHYFLPEGGFLLSSSQIRDPLPGIQSCLRASPVVLSGAEAGIFNDTTGLISKLTGHAAEKHRIHMFFN
jgi:hypothetical protein